MPIDRLLDGTALSLQEIDLLNAAYRRALCDLHLVERNDPICDIVARRVVDLYTSGVCDPQEIAALTVKQLGP